MNEVWIMSVGIITGVIGAVNKTGVLISLHTVKYTQIIEWNRPRQGSTWYVKYKNREWWAG